MRSSARGEMHCSSRDRNDEQRNRSNPMQYKKERKIQWKKSPQAGDD